MVQKIIFGLVVLVVVLAACQHHPEIVADDNTGGGGGGVVIIPEGNCSPDTVYFTNTIAPMLNSYCGGENCHDAVNPEDGINVTSYVALMNSDIIDPGNANNSDIMEAIYAPMSDDDHMPPVNESQLTSDQINQLITWINQGALNNGCTSACDTSITPTFSAFVSPLITNQCAGCHGSTNPDGNLPLTNYDQIMVAVNDGRLMFSLNGTDGYSIMPDNTTGLPQCQIDLIQEWISLGANND